VRTTGMETVNSKMFLLYPKVFFKINIQSKPTLLHGRRCSRKCALWAPGNFKCITPKLLDNHSDMHGLITAAVPMSC